MSWLSSWLFLAAAHFLLHDVLASTNNILSLGAHTCCLFDFKKTYKWPSTGISSWCERNGLFVQSNTCSYKCLGWKTGSKSLIRRGHLLQHHFNDNFWKADSFKTPKGFLGKPCKFFPRWERPKTLTHLSEIWFWSSRWRNFRALHTWWK